MYGKATKRMISEAVRIEGLDKEEGFNRKQGWTYTPLFREGPRNGNEGSFLEELIDDIEELEGGVYLDGLLEILEHIRYSCNKKVF